MCPNTCPGCLPPSRPTAARTAPFLALQRRRPHASCQRPRARQALRTGRATLRASGAEGHRGDPPTALAAHARSCPRRCPGARRDHGNRHPRTLRLSSERRVEGEERRKEKPRAPWKIDKREKVDKNVKRQGRSLQLIVHSPTRRRDLDARAGGRCPSS